MKLRAAKAANQLLLMRKRRKRRSKERGCRASGNPAELAPKEPPETSSPVINAPLPASKRCAILGALNRQDPVRLSEHEPLGRPDGSIITGSSRLRRKSAAKLPHSILLGLLSITVLSSAASYASDESTAGSDHHLTIQTRQGVFRGMLIPSEVRDWPSGLRSSRISENLSDMVVGFLGKSQCFIVSSQESTNQYLTTPRKQVSDMQARQ